MQAKSQAMTQGANALAMEQVVEKIERDRKLRGILAGAYTAPTPEIALEGPTPTGAALAPAPAQPGGMDWQGAMGAAAEGGVVPEMMEMQAGMTKARGAMPSSIREWQAYQQMSPEDQKRFLSMKRASQFQTIGGVTHQVGGGQPPRPLSTLEKEAEARGVLAAGAKEGAALGVARTELAEMKATLPRLEDVVTQLSGLGKTATYTKAGQIKDAAMREAGMSPGKGAIARREYIAKIDNEILPLLRLTFGAAFTKAEGDSLKATLGDVDASPAEKDAVLRSFIDSKRAQIKTGERRVGAAPTGLRKGTVKGGYVFMGGNPADPKSWKKK